MNELHNLLEPSRTWNALSHRTLARYGVRDHGAFNRRLVDGLRELADRQARD